MQYAFASPEWMAFLHGLQVERARVLREVAPELEWSTCEVFTDPPRGLSPDGRPLAWHSIVRAGVVEFGPTDRLDVGYRVVVPYSDVLPIVRFDTRGEPARRAELSELAAVLIKAGRMTVGGDRSQRDPRIGIHIHDAMARVTA